MAADAGVQYCVVCGAGSHRTDWKNKVGKYVACDSHAANEVKDAAAKVDSDAAATQAKATSKTVS